jgi:YVTN family beta-propeller protein
MKPLLTCVLLLCLASCKSQKTFGTERLTLIKQITLPGVKGRIDHMDINLQQHLLYVAALGNNSVEVVDPGKGSVIHSIKGLSEPQGVSYIAAQNEIAVACGGSGDCLFFDATTFSKIATVHLGSDADNTRVSGSKLFVGYGEGAIAVIDIKTHKLVADVKMAAHPESFQLDERKGRMYVNLPDSRRIAVIDLSTYKLISNWNVKGLRANFPMALDENLVIIGFRHPSVVACFNSNTGEELSRVALMEDTDDLFYYPAKKQVFASGGQGYIDIYQKEATNKLSLIANIPTSAGARTSLLVPSLNEFVVASRAEGGKEAAVRIYSIQ